MNSRELHRTRKLCSQLSSFGEYLLKVSTLPPMEYDGPMGCILTCRNGFEWLSKFLNSREHHRTRKLCSLLSSLGEYLLKVSPLPPMEYDGSMGCILTCRNGLEWFSKFLNCRERHKTRKLIRERTPLREFLLKVSPLPPMEYDGSMGCILTCRNGLEWLSKFLNSKE